MTRAHILSFRQHVGLLDRRIPLAAGSLRQAAWAGLQDSMPRAALLSIHARVTGATPSAWEHPTLVQLWGPRFNNYVVGAKDLPIFSLGRLPTDARRLARANDTASRLHAHLNGQRALFDVAGRIVKGNPNALRYAGPTGTVLMRWDGARQPLIWTVPPPRMDPEAARLELARRYLHVFGPATPASFSEWAGVTTAEAHVVFTALAPELTPVRTPIADALLLTEDVATLGARPQSRPPARARLLPSGDAYTLCWGADRTLLVADTKQRNALWTTRVWPGALLINGEIAGIWRRAASNLSIDTFRALSVTERKAVESEALSLPLPGLSAPISITWGGAAT